MVHKCDPDRGGRSRRLAEAAQRRRRSPTFAENVAPILYEKCVTCHRSGEAAPFALISYDDVKKKGRQMAKVTASRHMPPWHAAHGYGEFAGERRLSDDEIDTIGRWVRRHAGRGSEEDAGAPGVP